MEKDRSFLDLMLDRYKDQSSTPKPTQMIPRAGGVAVVGSASPREIDQRIHRKKKQGN